MSLIDGPLIDMDTPEDLDEWHDSLAGRLVFALTGLLLMRMGFRTWTVMMPEWTSGAVITMLLFAVAIQLLVFAASDLDFERWGRRMSYAVMLVIALAVLATMHRRVIATIQTDALLFSRASLDALAAGRNPFAMDMTPAIRDWRGPQFSTPRIDGTVVDSLSYPAGAVLWFAPQYVTVGPTWYGIRLTLFAVVLGMAATLVHILPARLAMAGVAGTMTARNWFWTAPGGVIDVLWMWPIIGAIYCWQRERWEWAAALVGLACATKQQPWLFLPFLAIWQHHRTGGGRAFLARAARMTGIGLAVFLGINLPFMIWNPAAWVTSVVTPVAGGAPLVHQGVGLTILSFVGALQLGTDWYLLTVVSMTAFLLTAYALFIDRLAWAAWVLPAFILLVHTRSLASYFVAFAPIAVAATAAATGRLQPIRWPTWARRPDLSTEVAD